MSEGFSGSCQRTELATTDRQEPRASLNEANPALELQSQSHRDLFAPNRDALSEGLLGFELVRYRVSPRRAPAWAIQNWRDAIRACKRSGSTVQTIRALTHQKVDDLHCLVDALKTCPQYQRSAVEAEWKSYHRTWVDDQVRRVECNTEPAGRIDPYSLRSIKDALSPADQRTWDAFRKLMSRKSRGTGKRNRKPGKEKRAVEVWKLTERQFETLLRLLIIDVEPIRYVERQCKLSAGEAVRLIPMALRSLRRAIESSKQGSLALNGPRQVSQEIVRNGQLYPGPQHHKARNHTEARNGQ